LQWIIGVVSISTDLKDKTMIDIRLSDNLELMAEMQDNTVDLIYCDILYGTGRKFKDYQDLKPKREVIEKHYIPRIKEMHRILKDTGSIYLQMDTKINHWLRCILDDIFGYDNFLNEITFSYNGGGISKKHYPRKSDKILFYTKTNNHFFDNELKPYSEWSAKNISWKHRNKKRMEDIKKGTPITEVWGDLKFKINYQEKEFTGYSTQKSKELIERIIKASSNEGDLVADFYGGSFTTAEVCKDLNRKFIGCDISEKAVAIGLERTKH
jgi:site-specific DNA-methyltransferase (adenine-specific)